MTRLIHDQFAKDYLEELLNSYGHVSPSRPVTGEVQEIDVLFFPSIKQNPNLKVLGLLGRFAEYPAIFEPFRNAASEDEIGDCIFKLWQIKAELRREAKRDNTSLDKSDIPKLWVLTPTASSKVLSSFGATQKKGWLPGVHFTVNALRTAIVAIHQLPDISETLWLRILGRGSIQEKAIIELQSLLLSHPFRQATLELVYNLQKNLRVSQPLEPDDRELIMRLEPLYQQDRELAKLEERRQIIENMLEVRFGSLDSELITLVSAISALPAKEFTPLLMQLSREELIARFGTRAS